MKPVPLVALSLIVAADTLAAGSSEVKYGTYICVTDRTVGFQTDEHTKERYAGAIKPSSNQAKFFATIRKVPNVPENVFFPIDGWLYHKHNWCFSEAESSKLQQQWEVGGDSVDKQAIGPDLTDFAATCLATSDLEVKDDGNGKGYHYYAIGKNYFVAPFNLFFWIRNDLSFQRYYPDFDGNFYLAEGRCELVQTQ